MDELVAQFVRTQQAQQAVQERTLEVQQLQNVRLVEEIRKLQGGASPDSYPNQFLLKLTEDDEVETYLCTFERIALRKGWPRPKSASLLAPFLSGNAQKAHWDLNDEQAAIYDGLKREILGRYGYSLAHRAQRFLDWRSVADAFP
jgi:hypothetical protein